MLSHSSTDSSIFSGKVRVRVCGLLEENGKLLLIKHETIGVGGYLWSPPGGGVEFGASMEETLKREFQEETGLSIAVGQFLFANEYIDTRHHAIEMFYKVQRIGGKLALGHDPELGEEDQILSELKFIGYPHLQKMDKRHLHNIFQEVKSPENVFSLKGLFSFKY